MGIFKMLGLSVLLSLSVATVSLAATVADQWQALLDGGSTPAEAGASLVAAMPTNEQELEAFVADAISVGAGYDVFVAALKNSKIKQSKLITAAIEGGAAGDMTQALIDADLLKAPEIVGLMLQAGADPQDISAIVGEDLVQGLGYTPKVKKPKKEKKEKKDKDGVSAG